MKLSDMSDAVVSSAVFAGIGLAVFGIAFWIIKMVAPFSMKKEIEEDQNVALGLPAELAPGERERRVAADDEHGQPGDDLADEVTLRSSDRRAIGRSWRSWFSRHWS